MYARLEAAICYGVLDSEHGHGNAGDGGRDRGQVQSISFGSDPLAAAGDHKELGSRSHTWSPKGSDAHKHSWSLEVGPATQSQPKACPYPTVPALDLPSPPAPSLGLPYLTIRR